MGQSDPKIDVGLDFPPDSEAGVRKAEAKIRSIFLELRAQGKELRFNAKRLVETLATTGHHAADATHAIVRLIESRKLRSERAWIEVPSAPDSPPLLPWHVRSPQRTWPPDKSGYAPIPEDKPTPFHSFDVVATDDLWGYLPAEHISASACNEVGRQPEAADDPLLTHIDLAKRFNLDRETARKRLDRWRSKNKGGDWIEATDKRPNEPKYLYRLSAVKHLFE